MQKSVFLLIPIALILLAGCTTTASVDEDERRWVITAKSPWLIGGYGDNFQYNGEDVREAEGTFLLDVDSTTEQGKLFVELKDITHHYAENEVLEGDATIVFHTFAPLLPATQGGIAEAMTIHGDTGRCAPVVPEVYTYLAGWGYADLYVNGVLIDADLESHFMFTEKVRRDNKKIQKDDGTIYDMSRKAEDGFVVAGEQDMHNCNS